VDICVFKARKQMPFGVNGWFRFSFSTMPSVSENILLSQVSRILVRSKMSRCRTQVIMDSTVSIWSARNALLPI